MKNKYILEHILNSFIDNLDEDLVSSDELIKKLPLLCDNNLACVLEDKYSATYGSYPSLYKVASYYGCTHNKNLKKFIRRLDDYEFGGKDNSSANEPEELLKVARSSLITGKYFIKLKGENYMVIVVGNEDLDNANLNFATKVYFIGKKWRKYKDKFNVEWDKYKDMVNKRDVSYIMEYAGGPKVETIFKSFDHLILKDKENIIEYIDNWLNNVPNYHEFGMIPKLSILLHGEPGTGKSTFAKALAKHLNIDTVTILHQNAFTFDDDHRVANRFMSPTVYLIDDIDCICVSRDNDKNDNKNSQILSNLLSFLDNPPAFNIKTKDGLQHLVSIVVATTNYYDKLDNAVKRYGRFDKKIEMKQFTKFQAEQMCDLYNIKLEDLAHKYKDIRDALNSKNFKISPSYLQSVCLENIDKSLKGDK